MRRRADCARRAVYERTGTERRDEVVDRQTVTDGRQVMIARPRNCMTSWAVLRHPVYAHFGFGWSRSLGGSRFVVGLKIDTNRIRVSADENIQ